ncbi:hypothetical protein [Pseudomonas frederiksbergensis]|uniref:Uncharacterized protein n=1 Tax=Pseudomonas frederiksbergensis TaxID=104087 RepID=A0A423JY16_9PSED|nr:hypothetical protein [Pseudomonas frederiksbergensis]RON42599.1 hypothetical protein BK666_22940 [Pseudomonas frederiksbergensis]RON56338.1 hypothetical protein BK667_08325 [Pseudomonas frederiksbergensis]
MQTTTSTWQNVPVLRAETKVITTPTHSSHAANCPGWDGLRFNIGNIHEIKKIRDVTAGR